MNLTHISFRANAISSTLNQAIKKAASLRHFLIIIGGDLLCSPAAARVHLPASAVRRPCPQNAPRVHAAAPRVSRCDRSVSTTVALQRDGHDVAAERGFGIRCATLTIHSSIIHGTHADGGLQSDVSVNVVDGANTNTSSLAYTGKNFVGQTYVISGATQTGISPSTADPLLGSLSLYAEPPGFDTNTPVLPIGSNSPAYNAAPSCLESDGSTTLTTDERGAAPPPATPSAASP